MESLLFLLLPFFQPAESTSVAEKLLKVVSYDRNLQARTPEGLRLAILFTPGSEESGADAVEIEKHLGALSRARSPLAPATVEAFAFATQDELLATLVARRISALYVAPGFAEEQLASVVHAAESAGVMTLAGDPEDVARGLVAGVLREGESQKIVVNMGAAERCGVDFDPAVRQVAQRVGSSSSEPVRSDLSAVLIRYREAIQTKDMAALRSVWPKLSDQEAKRVEASLANVRSHQVFLAPLRIQSDGPLVKIRVRRADQLVTGNGDKLVSGRLIEIVFSRSGEGTWVIDSMGEV